MFKTLLLIVLPLATAGCLGTSAIAVNASGGSSARQANASRERIEGARLAIGAVAATTLVVDVSAMIGRAPNDETFAIAGAAASAAARPIDDMRGGVAQRTKLTGVLTIRALNIALQRIASQGAVEAR